MKKYVTLFALFFLSAAFCLNAGIDIDEVLGGDPREGLGKLAWRRVALENEIYSRKEMLAEEEEFSQAYNQMQAVLNSARYFLSIKELEKEQDRKDVEREMQLIISLYNKAQEQITFFKEAYPIKEEDKFYDEPPGSTTLKVVESQLNQVPVLDWEENIQGQMLLGDPYTDSEGREWLYINTYKIADKMVGYKIKQPKIKAKNTVAKEIKEKYECEMKQNKNFESLATDHPEFVGMYGVCYKIEGIKIPFFLVLREGFGPNHISASDRNSWPFPLPSGIGKYGKSH